LIGLSKAPLQKAEMMEPEALDGDALISRATESRVGHEVGVEVAAKSAGYRTRKEDKSPLLPKHQILEALEVENGEHPLGMKGMDLPESGTASVSRYALTANCSSLVMLRNHYSHRPKLSAHVFGTNLTCSCRIPRHVLMVLAIDD
jgi:hypothetical protein